MAIKHNQQIQKNHFHKDWYATYNFQFQLIRRMLTSLQAALRPRALRPGMTRLFPSQVIESSGACCQMLIAKSLGGRSPVAMRGSRRLRRSLLVQCELNNVPKVD